MIKKFLVVTLALAMALTFAACGGSGKGSSDNPENPVDPPEEPEKTYALTLAEDALSLLEGDTGVEVAIGSFTVDGAAADASLLQYESSTRVF